MSALTSLALIGGGVALTLAALLSLLVLWLDWRTLSNALNSLITAAAAVWYLGSLVGRISADIGAPAGLTGIGAWLSELGFAVLCVGLYVYTVVLSGATSRLLWLALPGMLLLIGYRAFLLAISAAPSYTVAENGSLLYGYDPVWAFLYGLMAFATLIVAWQRRRKLPDILLRIGLVVAALGAFVELVSPQLRQRGLSLDMVVCGIFLVAYAQVRLHIVRPLAGRADELRGFRDVGLAITSRLQLDEALKTIAAQAAAMLHADGAAIFLQESAALELAAVHNMPERLIKHRLASGEGLAGKVARSEE